MCGSGAAIGTILTVVVHRRILQDLLRVLAACCAAAAGTTMGVIAGCRFGTTAALATATTPAASELSFSLEFTVVVCSFALSLPQHYAVCEAANGVEPGREIERVEKGRCGGVAPGAEEAGSEGVEKKVFI